MNYIIKPTDFNDWLIFLPNLDISPNLENLTNLITKRESSLVTTIIGLPLTIKLYEELPPDKINLTEPFKSLVLGNETVLYPGMIEQLVMGLTAYYYQLITSSITSTGIVTPQSENSKNTSTESNVTQYYNSYIDKGIITRQYLFDENETYRGLIDNNPYELKKLAKRSTFNFA